MTKKIEELKKYINKQVTIYVTIDFKDCLNTKSTKIYKGFLKDVKKEHGVYRAYFSNCTVEYVNSNISYFENSVDGIISRKGHSFEIK